MEPANDQNRLIGGPSVPVETETTGTSGEFRELCRDYETTAAQYSTLFMNGIILIAGCVFAGFFVIQALRLSHTGVDLLQKAFAVGR